MMWFSKHHKEVLKELELPNHWAYYGGGSTKAPEIWTHKLKEQT